MTLEALKAALDASGLPFAYHHWETEKNPPYGVYLYVYDTQFFADGELYFSTGHYQVELYTQRKDPSAEGKVEAALTAVGLGFGKSEHYLDSEKLYKILYEIEV